MSSHVFTYWEGDPYPFTELCLDSIGRVFGDRHKHLGPDSVSDWIDLPVRVRDSPHILFRSDYIRGELLRSHGGWWFDSDVILMKDPSELVSDLVPRIWNLMYCVEGAWVALVNCGILFSPMGAEWLERIMEDMRDVDPSGLGMTIDNEDIGQDIYEKWSVGTGLCFVGDAHCFNSTVNVDADYRPFWDGVVGLSSVDYGLHIGASLSRWASLAGDARAGDVLRASSLESLVTMFPESFVAQYLRSLQS
ncbi:MAG: hypothetical protein KA110_10480 [Acidimicrobiia bacterium]|nr:hypothetical protein [Acidimicrobiia bacterium]